MDEVQTTQPHLLAVAAGLSLLADLKRADILLYELIDPGRVRVVAQAQPHSVPPIYAQSLVGREQSVAELPAVAWVLQGREAAQGARQLMEHRSHVVQRAYAVDDKSGRRVGVLTVEKSLVEHERHATRRAPFNQTLEDLRDMVLRGETEYMAGLSSFDQSDGIMLVNEKRVITYVSGLGSYHYRLLGYSEELVGKSIAHLDTADAELVEQAFRDNRPFEYELTETERIWIRKLIPVVGPQYRLPPKLALFSPHGFGKRVRRVVLITIHDATAARRKAQEKLVRQAMVQEIHHRVKNNLQTVASLLRMQARRAQHEETRQILHGSINRILSIAVVHEFLSQYEKAINMHDVAHRIVRQVREGILDASQEVTLQVEGDAVFLHAHQTTMVALVINELILNALEHGIGDSGSGTVTISFTDAGDDVGLVVHDTGAGLPENFTLAEANSLGLRIVQTIVEQDLRGSFALLPAPDGTGTCAQIAFPKAAPEVFE